jgi:DNA (cytosine-5)-methyltransferase 1
MTLTQTPSGFDDGKALAVVAELFSDEPRDVQVVWDALDDFVIRSSSFHSLFELYGHFTEPHPIFTIDKFVTSSSRHPILVFGEHAADFNNCSTLFPTAKLGKIFGKSGEHDILSVIEELRSYRYDVRCHETNAPIPPGKYMVAYPFTLPFRKQMNFRIRRSLAS